MISDNLKRFKEVFEGNTAMEFDIDPNLTDSENIRQQIEWYYLHTEETLEILSKVAYSIDSDIELPFGY